MFLAIKARALIRRMKSFQTLAVSKFHDTSKDSLAKNTKAGKEGLCDSKFSLGLCTYNIYEMRLIGLCSMLSSINDNFWTMHGWRKIS